MLALAGTCLLLVGWPGGTIGRRLRAAARVEDLVHVCFCTDETDLRALTVAIKSAVASASAPGDLRFHVVTTPQLAGLYREVLPAHLPGVLLQVYHDAELQKRIQSQISLHESSRARRSLGSPLNFAPFYLHAFLGQADVKRVICLDTDTLILGDLAELQRLDLRGHPVAAVKRCSERWEDYIEFETLRGLGFTKYDPQSCITDRVVFVYDAQIWARKKLTTKIEEWLARYRASREDLWFDGMALPPWMLALGDDFLELGEEWACAGPARESMSLPESRAIRRSGFDFRALKMLDVQFTEFGRIRPYLTTCSAGAKLLHYSGGMRPWRRERFVNSQAPLCAVPVVLHRQDWAWSRTVKVYCEDATFVPCHEIWWKFISTEEACALQDFDREWQEDEDIWMDKRMDSEEARRGAEREARERKGADDKERLERAEERRGQRRRERSRFHWGSEDGRQRPRRDKVDKDPPPAAPAQADQAPEAPAPPVAKPPPVPVGEQAAPASEDGAPAAPADKEEKGAGSDAGAAPGGGGEADEGEEEGEDEEEGTEDGRGDTVAEVAA